MKTKGRRGSVTLLLCLLTIRHVKTDGKLDIRFISYWSDGKVISGHCCDDDLTIWWNDECNPKFTLCIDVPYGRVPCSLSMGTTNYIDNHNTIHFGSSVLGTANPIIISVPKAVPSSLKIKVQVFDNDYDSNGDLMDTLSKLINIQAAATEQTAVYTPYTLGKRTKLQIQVRAYCDPDWYGSVCEKYCKAPSDQSHYTCHAHTGANVCFEGIFRRCWPAHCLGVVLGLWLLLISYVKTDGKLDIRFISYWSDGKVISGHCCDDDLTIWCNDKCDPKFILCIDWPDGAPCSLYFGATNYIDNHNTIHFGSSIQGTANPIIIPVPKAVPSSIQITVKVFDYDDTPSHDHMDTLYKLINIQAAATEQTAVYTPYTVWGRTKLQIEVRAYCDPDWYGPVCEKYCKATTDQCHYTCNGHTGAKVCFEGWEGDNCDQDIDECTGSNMCQHGGICTNTPGRFECICIEGIKGRRCEIITNQCALKSCLNGGTCDGNETGFNCACSVDWTGETCAETINFCDSAPCNRGNCTPNHLTATGFKCDCDFAWVGKRCSQSVDTANITLLGEIDHKNRGDLTDGLNRLIAELGEIPGKVDVTFTTNTQTECNDEVLNEYLPLPLYPPRQKEKSTVKRPHGSWDTDQYVLAVLLPLGLVLMTVLPLVAFGIWKRKSDTSQCIDEANDQISSFGMDEPCSRNPNRPSAVTINLQDASVSLDGYTRLRFHDVHRGTLVTHCDDTSNIHGAGGDMTLDPWSQEGASFSPDDNARHGDAATFDTRRHVTSYIQPVSGDMTLDPCNLRGEEEDAEYTVIDDNVSQEDRYEKIMY